MSSCCYGVQKRVIKLHFVLVTKIGNEMGFVEILGEDTGEAADGVEGDPAN